MLYGALSNLVRIPSLLKLQELSGSTHTSYRKDANSIASLARTGVGTNGS